MTRIEFTRELSRKLLAAGYTRGGCLKWHRPNGTRIYRTELAEMLYTWSLQIPAPQHRPGIGTERFWNRLSYEAGALLRGEA